MSAAPAPDPLHDAARAWWDAGFAVIPSHEDGSKRPFGPWREYQQTRPTWAEVEGWLASGRYTGIGVICGAASGGAEMVEIEGPADEAVSRLGAVMAAAGMAGLTDLVATVARGCVEQSAGGGLHMFLRVSDGAAKPNTKLAMTGTAPNRRVVAETRGEGGFVIVAPTPGRKGHPEGASYLFLQGSSPEGTPTVSASERDEIHDLLRYALHDGEDDLGAPTPATPTASVAHVEPTSAFGDYRARTTWRDLLTPLGWREGPTERDGRTHWTRPGGQRFEGTSATTIEDGPMYVFSTNAGLPSERGLSKEYVYAAVHHGGDLRAAGAALRASGYGSATATSAPSLTPWQPADGALPPEVADMTPEQAEAELRERWVHQHLPRLDWHAIWADDSEEEWIIEPLIAARRGIALYSAPKVGKSILMLEIAAAIATGRGMFGHPSASGPRRTLYVDFENDPRGDTRARLIDMGYAPGDLDNLVMLSYPTLAALDTDDGGRQLMAAVLTYRCELVIIDTVSRSVEGDENENSTWLSWYRSTGLRLKQAGVAYARLDHSGKDATKGQRGGSAKSGDVDAIWQLRKVDDSTLELECDSSRFIVSETLLTLRRLDDPLRHVVQGDDWKRQRDDLMAKMSRAGVPRDPDLAVRAVARMLRDAGEKYRKGHLTRAVIHRYSGSLPTFDTPPMVSE